MTLTLEWAIGYLRVRGESRGAASKINRQGNAMCAHKARSVINRIARYLWQFGPGSTTKCT